MAVPTYPNSISLGDIQTEFGGSNPAGMDEYYAGGTNVPSGTANATSVTIPTSGQISFINFSGAIKTASLPVTYTYQNQAASGSITVPTNAANISIIIQAGGGGGGGWNGSQSRKGAGGGGGGGLWEQVRSFTSADWGKSFSWAIGARGLGGAGDTKYSGSSGTAGGQCNVVFSSAFSFGAVTFWCNGGSGGSSGGSGGAGGTSSTANYTYGSGNAGQIYSLGGAGGSGFSGFGSGGDGGAGAQTFGANGSDGDWGYLQIYIQ